MTKEVANSKTRWWMTKEVVTKEVDDFRDSVDRGVPKMFTLIVPLISDLSSCSRNHGSHTG